MSYFGVYIPETEVQGTEDTTSSPDISTDYQSLIFVDKSQALKVLHRHKEARLREFPNREQAENYVQFGQQQEEQQELQALPPVTGERSLFDSPTKQELQQFRKQIEAGNLELVRQIVWGNPRYLISSGDTPTRVKEGPRYNAMHICAQLNRPSIAEFLLETVADPKFAQLYTDNKERPEMCADLSRNLLDLYLNMPDKARGETPLHFAVKNGHVEMVELLIGYPGCKSLPNREGKEPRDIICQRNDQASVETLKKLELLMKEPFYVPVLRSKTNEVPPQVGEPYSPKEPPNLELKNKENGDLGVKVAISALAGPMPREEAMKFYCRWKTPPRLGSKSMSPLASLPFTSPVKMTPSTPSPMQMSRRVLFGPEQVDSQELPCTSATISNTEDSLLQDLTQELSMCTLNDSFRERHIKNSDLGKGLEVVGRQLAHQAKLEWREYWHFLDSFVDICSAAGMTQLEAYLQSKMEQARKGAVTRNFVVCQSQTQSQDRTEAQDHEQIYKLLYKDVNSTDSEDEDSFIDCSSSNTSSEDSYQTVPELPIFINGEEPTRCDLDVLNAIFNVDVNEKTLPHIQAWKTAMERFSTKEMEHFSSPKHKNIRKLQWGLDNCQTSIHPKGLFRSTCTNAVDGISSA